MLQQNQTLFILIWAKTNRIKQGKAPLYLRITINGRRAEITAQRAVSITEWDPKSQSATGRSTEAWEINNHPTVLKSKILACYNKLELSQTAVTVEMVKMDLLGIVEKPRLLMEIIREHNKEIKTLIGKGYAEGTWLEYNTVEMHIKEFIQWKYRRKDLSLKDLKLGFVTDFEFFLRAEKNIGTNTNAKYIRNFRKIIHECVAKDWLDKDPFMAYKFKSQKTNRGYLTELELQAIQEKEFLY